MYNKREFFTNFFFFISFYKKALLFLPISIIFFLTNNILPTSYVSAQQSTDNFISYNNSTAGIKIDYPADWQKIEGGQGFLAQPPTKNVSVVVGFSPPDKSAYVFVTIEKIAPNKTLSQDVNESIATIRKDIPDYKILESEQTTLASLPAYKLVSEETIPMRKIGEKFGVPNEKIQEIESMLKAIGSNPKVKVLTVFAIKDNKEYGVSYGTAPELLAGDQYSVYLPTAQKMIDSFQIMGSSAVTNTSTVKPTINEQNQTCGQFLDPLKTRLVEGNITIQQYGDLRKAIGC